MKNEIMIVWSTDNKETAENMVLLYAKNAKLKGWFDEVTLLIWGASQKLLVQDEYFQKLVKEASEAGVKVVACKKCSENLGIENALEACSVELFYTGVLLSDWAKSGKPLLTF
ncbi:MAG: DsrE family protein [Epsilonproteobacteria bacterium]|nr:DsrE family protein [Campylobacterota bacterium]